MTNTTSGTERGHGTPDALRQYSEIHIGEDCKDISGRFENALFFECQFPKLRGLTLERCVLTRSSFKPETLRDALGFTATFDCHSFKDVELNELAFDALLVLLTLTKGNTEKRNKLVEVIGKDRYLQLIRKTSKLEL